MKAPAGSLLSLVLGIVLLSGTTARGVVIMEWAYVGDAGNAGQLSGAGAPGGEGHDRVVGSVNYDYFIGKYEVTNSQYAEFLSAVAVSDPYELYQPGDGITIGMGAHETGGITRSGTSGSYTYAVKPNMGNKPVNYVSVYDVMRFVNWLENGQGNGDTESGTYTLMGGTPIPSNGTTITRNSGAIYFLPNEDEWHKAAYFQPASLGGDSDDYWLYPTSSNTAPTKATATATGDISNPGPNVQNYYNGAEWGITGIRSFTTVGTAGPESASYYGTHNQGDNAREWTETIENTEFGTRVFRGADIIDGELRMRGTTRHDKNPASDDLFLGFRLGSVTGYNPPIPPPPPPPDLESDLIYEPATGNVRIDASEGPGAVVTGFVLKNAAGGADFNHNAAIFPFNSIFTTKTPTEISQLDTNFVGFIGIHDFGNIFPAGMDLKSLSTFLTVANYTGALGTGTKKLELVLQGQGVTGTDGGGPGTTGGVAYAFNGDVTTGGTFTAEYLTADDVDLDSLLPAGAEQRIDFIVASAPVQFWNISFSGQFEGDVTLTLAYDEANLLVAEEDLLIYHFTGGAWTAVTDGFLLDTDANTIIIHTDSFSPFMLGSPSATAAIPEPATWLLATLGLFCLGVYARRHKRLGCPDPSRPVHLQ